jgi:hypothetical protein
VKSKPPLIACPIVGDGCARPPSLHILSFQLWQARLSASRIRALSNERRYDSPFRFPREDFSTRDLGINVWNAGETKVLANLGPVK